MTPEQKERAERIAPYGTEMPKWLTRALADPGSVVKRYWTKDADGWTDYEPVYLWQARAVLASITMHAELEAEEPPLREITLPVLTKALDDETRDTVFRAVATAIGGALHEIEKEKKSDG